MTKEEAFSDDEDLITWDGFDEAIVGLVARCGMEPVVLYDAAMMRDLLVARDGMTEEEAQEYLDFNVFGAYVGERTPMHLERFPGT
jgi:hypothetical protein